MNAAQGYLSILDIGRERVIAEGMTKNSFEVFTLKKGQWQIDCVFNSKKDATDEAARMVQAGHFDGIKVVQEDYDERLNRAKVVVVTGNGSKGKRAPSHSGGIGVPKIGTISSPGARQ